MHLKKALNFFFILPLLFLGVFLPSSPKSTGAKESKSDTTAVSQAQIIQEYLFYAAQLRRNYPKLQPYINKMAMFDTLNSKGKILPKQNYEKYLIALVTQESNFIQKKYDGTILKSYANAAGVAQFTSEGVKAVNKYLSQRRDTTGKTEAEKLISEQYAKQKDVDLELLLDTGKKGVEEGYRAASLLSKIQLLRHPDSWKFAAIEYNSGRMRRGNYERVKRRIPRETRDYVERLEQHMAHYEKGNYLRYLILRWGVVMIELENMRGNQAMKKGDSEEAKLHYENALILNEYLIQNKLDTTMRYHDNMILHVNYELGNLKAAEGDTMASLDHYFEVIKTKNKKKRYEYRNAKFYLNKIKERTNDTVIKARTGEIIQFSDSI